MKIQAELSLYPLKTDSLENTIRRFIEELSQPGISITPSTMSTSLAGESDEVFRVISQCFARACTTEEVVLVAKFSNACPTKSEFDREKK